MEKMDSNGLLPESLERLAYRFAEAGHSLGVQVREYVDFLPNKRSRETHYFAQAFLANGRMVAAGDPMSNPKQVEEWGLRLLANLENQGG